jgi:AcrR family transcriptional regulator
MEGVEASRRDGDWTAKGRSTRARIVDAASGLMYEQGVANTSTEDIREAAGISNSQLYHYFADKDDLTRAVVEHQIELVLAQQEPLTATVDSFAGLERWRDTLVEMASRRHGRGGCPIGSLASELSDLDEDARAALDAGFARWETAIRGGLAAMRERGELREGADPEELALATVASLQGGLLLSQVRRDSRPLRVALDGAIGRIRGFAA